METKGARNRKVVSEKRTKRTERLDESDGEEEQEADIAEVIGAHVSDVTPEHSTLISTCPVLDQSLVGCRFAIKWDIGWARHGCRDCSRNAEKGHRQSQRRILML